MDENWGAVIQRLAAPSPQAFFRDAMKASFYDLKKKPDAICPMIIILAFRQIRSKKTYKNDPLIPSRIPKHYGRRTGCVWDKLLGRTPPPLGLPGLARQQDSFFSRKKSPGSIPLRRPSETPRGPPPQAPLWSPWKSRRNHTENFKRFLTHFTIASLGTMLCKEKKRKERKKDKLQPHRSSH